MTPFLIYGLIIGAVVVGSTLLTQYILKRRTFWQNYRFRLTSLSQSMSKEAIYEQSTLVEEARQEMAKSSIRARLKHLYTQSGVTFSPMFLWLAAGLITLILFLLLSRALGDPAFRLVISAAAGGGLVLYYLSLQRKKRVNEFVRQLPDAIEVIVRSLRAGHPLNEGLKLVGEEMSAPLGPEFRKLTDQVAVGSAVDSALIKMFFRVGADEIKLLAVTVSVQAETGGNLAEVLENMAGMIRQRLLLRIKVTAITAEGRASAVIMSMFPAILFAIIMSLAPSYFDPLVDSGYIVHFAAVCMIMVGMGVFILFRLVKLDI